MPDPERTRRQNAKDRVLALFQARGTVTNLELGQVCQRYGARIYTARREGHLIDPPVSVAPGVFSYTYRGFQAPGQMPLRLSA